MNSFTDLPTQNLEPHANLLLCGSPGVGKRTLGRCLVQYPDPAFQVNVHTTVEIGKKSTESTISRPRIDLVVLLVNLTNRASFLHMASVLGDLDPSYFMGRLVIVATHASEVTSHSVSIDELEIYISNLFEVPIIYTDLPRLQVDGNHLSVPDIPIIPRLWNIAKTCSLNRPNPTNTIFPHLANSLFRYIHIKEG